MAGHPHHSSGQAPCCSASTLNKGCCLGSPGATVVQSAEGSAYLVKVGVDEPRLGAVVGDGELQVGLRGDQARQLVDHALRCILRRPQRILHEYCS